jgi:hypothetical protein
MSLPLLFIHAGALHGLANSLIGLELKLWAQEIYGIWNIRKIQNRYIGQRIAYKLLDYGDE